MLDSSLLTRRLCSTTLRINTGCQNNQFSINSLSKPKLYLATTCIFRKLVIGSLDYLKNFNPSGVKADPGL